MLHATIDLTHNGHTRFNWFGDIICLRKPMPVYPIVQGKEFLQCEWEDLAIEAHLNMLESSGNKFPIVVEPYRNFSKDTHHAYRSTIYIDVNSMPNKIEILDKQIYVPTLKFNEIKPYIKYRL